MEAYLRLIGYPIVQMSHQVVEMPIHLEGEEHVIFEDENERAALGQLKKNSKLTGFFELCGRGCEDGDLARTLLYDEVEKYFSWSKEDGTWNRRKNNLSVKIIKSLNK